MSYAVVTTFSPKGYEVYGRRMIQSFAKHWPAGVPLYVYYEELPSDASPRAEWRALSEDADRTAFMSKYTDKDPKDYRTCSVRYSHKVWAMTDAPRDTDNLIWLDGDCETFAPVTPEMLKAVCGDKGQVGSFLGRPYHRHTETGFWSVRMDTCGDDFLDQLRKVYTSGELFKLPELHDCMAFDLVRKRFERMGHRFKNICPDARGLGVFEQSRLREFLKHNKGPEAKLVAYGDSMLGDVA